MIRLFAAIALPPDLVDRLAGLARGLPGRVVPPENLHLTLMFFGEIAEDVATELHHALEAVAAPRFALTLDGVGAFGGAKPHSLHVCLRPEPALAHLRAKVAQAARLAGLNAPAERYTPHVTLTRLAPGEIGPAAAAKALEARAAFLSAPFAVSRFGLWRSDLGKRGPAYAVLAEYPLT